MEFSEKYNGFYTGPVENPDAEITYYMDGNTAVINHTYVNPALRGQGIAIELMKCMSRFAKEKGHRLEATCWYAEEKLKQNPDLRNDI